MMTVTAARELERQLALARLRRREITPEEYWRLVRQRNSPHWEAAYVYFATGKWPPGYRLVLRIKSEK